MRWPQHVGSSELFGVDVADEGRSRVGLGRCALAEGPVGTVGVVVLDVLAEHDFEVAPSQDEHPVQALAPDGADVSLGEGVGWRRPHGHLDDRDALRDQDGVEGRAELWCLGVCPSARAPCQKEVPDDMR